MAYRGDGPAPLLPASLEDGLKRWLWKVLGFLLLAACAALSASLLTWSVADPSLSRATSASARNLLGPPGALLSDLTMQMLGLAGVFALLPPLFWALELLTAKEPPSLRRKLVLAPLAVLFLAGALSSLPKAAAWPLHHGYGGVLGDLGLSILTSLLGHVNADRSAAAAGLFCFAAGMMGMMWSLGLTQRDIKLICSAGVGAGAGRRADARRSRVDLGAVAGWWRQLQTQTFSPKGNERSGPDPALMREPPIIRAKPAPLEVEPVVEAPEHDPVVPEIVPERRFEPVPDPAPQSGRGIAFDHSTDRLTRTIAERFAPAGTETARETSAARQEPELPLPDESTALPEFAPPPATHVPVPRGGEAGCRRPPLSILKRPAAGKAGAQPTAAELRNQARQLESVLSDFGVRGEVKGIHPGPVVTLFELEPARGTKSARVIGLADDIARSLGAASVRAAVVAGRNAIGIELPNPRREKVNLRQLFEENAFRTTDAALPLALGRDIAGGPIVADLARMPHLLVAGTTGSGKSVGVNAMILSLIYKLSPDQCRLLMIDPKMLELSVYNGIPHLLCPAVTEPEKAVAALNWVVAEMEDRYRRMAHLSVRGIDAFNARVRQMQKSGADPSQVAQLASMPHIIVIVDEFADLMIVAGKEIESAVQRLAQMARAAGIHLIMATQRPSVDIITGTIKANFPTRISFKVASKIDSRTILDEQGAEHLLGHGDMLYANGMGRTLRVHGAFVSDDEVEGVAAYLRDQGPPRYIDGITEPRNEQPALDARGFGSADEDLYARAVAIVRRDQKASTSYLQRRLLVGYNRAADLMERMEREGVVGAAGYNGRRQVLAN
jgi:DNA segregation ATPase FtsK/SpoIIIE, S-DNA-T family